MGVRLWRRFPRQVITQAQRLIATKTKDSSHGLALRRRMKHTGRSNRTAAALLISALLVAAAFVPAAAHAGVIADFLARIAGTAKPDATVAVDNLQTLSLPTPAHNHNPASARGGGDVQIVDDAALVPAEGPSGTIADIEKPKNSTISRYIVREGDTLSGIASMFKVSVNTLRWANDIGAGQGIHPGQQLVVLPVTGLRYTVKSGDTLASIAKKFDGDSQDIASFNGIDSLGVGDEIIIPNGEIAAPAPTKAVAKVSIPTGGKKVSASIGAEPAHDVGPVGTAAQDAYYIAPLSHYIKTQGVHGYNAVDLADPVGTPIVAAAAGDVIVAKQGGWNGGYGSYVVIQHSNGSQTLYGHMSEVDVYDGAHVQQGQVIGAVGSTGKSTGSHLHFEIRNGIRNPF